MSNEEYQYVKVSEEPEINVRVAYLLSTRREEKYPPIVIIPGWLSTIELFLPLGRELAKFTDVYIYEPHGFGPKEKPRTPHKKGLFTEETYIEEMEKIMQYLKLEDNKFVILGSCSGAALTFCYMLNSDGPKPLALATFSPQATYKTPFRNVILSFFAIVPSFLMGAVQAIVIALLNFYLKFRNPEETKNIRHAAKQLQVTDAWCQRRVVIEFIRKYDIRERIQELKLPMISFVAKEDWFTTPEKSKMFLVHPNSKFVQLECSAHRIQEDNEETIALQIRNFLDELRKQ
ncbi:MAG: alpha/beta fold hydrolase [Candidatus Heimdallarchaeaceae archaeon]